MARCIRRTCPRLLETMALGVLLWMATATAGLAVEVLVLGYVEKVQFSEGGMVLEGKLDTGADNSSINAAGIEHFERDGEKWVRFIVVNDAGDRSKFEKPVARTAEIKSHGGPSLERPVVKLGICVGQIHKTVEVNLADRSKFRYPVLLGRSFLSDKILVNASEKLTMDPNCAEGVGK